MRTDDARGEGCIFAPPDGTTSQQLRDCSTSPKSHGALSHMYIMLFPREATVSGNDHSEDSRKTIGTAVRTVLCTAIVHNHASSSSGERGQLSVQVHCACVLYFVFLLPVCL